MLAIGASVFGDPLQIVVIVVKMPQAIFLHEGHCIWKVRKFLDITNDAQIFPQG
jgi:hypothetical protein